MNEENQEPNKTNSNDQQADDSRSPGVDRMDSPGVDRGLGSSENASKNKNNIEESNKDSETK